MSLNGRLRVKALACRYYVVRGLSQTRGSIHTQNAPATAGPLKPKCPTPDAHDDRLTVARALPVTSCDGRSPPQRVLRRPAGLMHPIVGKLTWAYLKTVKCDTTSSLGHTNIIHTSFSFIQMFRLARRRSHPQWAALLSGWSTARHQKAVDKLLCQGHESIAWHCRRHQCEYSARGACDCHKRKVLMRRRNGSDTNGSRGGI